MNRNLSCALLLWISCHVMAVAQTTGFDSFVSRISKQYKLDIAIAPELIPKVDSILESGTVIASVQDLLRLLVRGDHISYQLVDGNKLMLRQESHPAENAIQAILEGNILSMTDGSPLAFAAVSLLNTPKGCLADENGHFMLPVSDTTGTLVFHYLGYTEVTIPITQFLKGHTSVRMNLREMPLEEVTIIIPYRDVNANPATQSLDLGDYYIISEQQLLQGNVERMINALTAYTPFSSEEGIRIRGVAPENSLLLMDGLPVYDAYHFYNIFSPFNGHYFSSAKLYKNNLPVPYGGRIDGMVQLGSDRKHPKSHLILDSDLLLTSLETQMVLSNNLSLKLGGRVSHTEILNDALQDSTGANFSTPGKYTNENEWTSNQQPTFNFYDVNAGLTQLIGSAGKGYFTFFSSKDELEYITRSNLESTNWNQESFSIQQVYTSDDIWKNLGFAGGVELETGKRTQMLIDAFSSQYDKRESYTSNFEDDRDHHPHISKNDGYQQSELRTMGLRATLVKDIARHSGFQAGVDVQAHKVMFQARENHTTYVSQTQHDRETSLFGEYHRKWFNRLDLYAGSRLTHLNSTNRIYILPNLRMNYFLADHLYLKSAFSKNLQAVHELTVENRFGREMETLVLSEPEEGYPALRSDKYMIGVGYTTGPLSFDAEGYYKKINGLARVSALKPDPGFDDPTSPDNFYHLLSGSGYTTGLDVTVLYKEGKVEGAVYYSLSKIAEQYDELFNGEYFSPQEDRRHQIKLSGKYKWGRVSTTLLLTYKSEAPYISFVRLEGRGGIGMENQQNVVRYLPPFFSLDIGADYSFDLFKQPAQLGVSLINSTNHANVDELQHIGRVPRDGGHQGGPGGFYITQQTELLGRTGNVHFRILL